MAKEKISVSIETSVLEKIEAIRILEHRNSTSNTIESLLRLDAYEFVPGDGIIVAVKVVP